MEVVETVITKENFNEKWEYVNNTLELIAKRKIIRKAVTFVGNVIFMFYLVVLAFGVLYQYENASFQAYLDATPFFANAWKWMSSILTLSEVHWIVQLVLYLLPGYVLVAFVCGIVFALIWFLYKPKSKHVLAENLSENAAELYKMTRFARIRTERFSPATSFACNVLFIFGIMVFLTGYVIQLMETSNEVAMAELMMLVYGTTISPYFSNMLFITMGGIIFMSTYTLFNSVMGYMLMPMYVTKFPEEMVTETENFYHECNPEVKARFEEEEKILAQANEIQKRRREEKKAFEDELRWKNPIWKKVKAGCIIAIVIGLVLLFGWLSSKVDMDSIMDTVDSYRENGEVLDTEGTEAPEGSEG